MFNEMQMIFNAISGSSFRTPMIVRQVNHGLSLIEGVAVDRISDKLTRVFTLARLFDKLPRVTD